MFAPRVRSALGCFLALTVLSAPTARAQRAAVEGRQGMVASAHELATQAGVEILKRGGNAVDAAVATGLALTVVYPFAGNIGGGGFMIVHLADGRQVALDFREVAPAAATRDMYLGADGNVLTGANSSVAGWRASGVPGSVAGFALALEKYGSGKVTWADVCEPARRLAADGHVVSQGTAANLRTAKNAAHLGQFEESKRIYLNGGKFLAAGELWRQPDLAATFARLQKNGPREFYEGETARLIADAMTKHGGTITLADLKNYKAVERVPLRGKYREHEIVTMPPPSSGGIALLQMFAMLEPFDVHALGRDSAAKYHLFTEAMRRAFRDRAEYLGDPDYVSVPTAGLIDRGYVAGLMKNFDPAQATRSEGLAPGQPVGTRKNDGGGSGPGKTSAPYYMNPLLSLLLAESHETTHFSVVDAAGNATATTYTLNGAYGSGVTIPGTGILMNNEMDDFTAKVGVKNMFGLLQSAANAIQPGKRPLSSMTPTLVFKDGKLLLVTGSPGGPTIINTVLQVVTNVIDHGMPVAQAVEAPRIHHQWMPDELTYERYGMSEDTVALLTAKGHKLKERNSYEGAYQGDAETIAIDPKTGRLFGAADPRKSDSKAIGY